MTDMNMMMPRLGPDTLLEKIAVEAIAALSLCGTAAIPEITPLEESLPLVAKAWGLPAETLRRETARIEQCKALAAEGKGRFPEVDLYESYEGRELTEIYCSLFETAVRLEAREERAVLYDTALFFEEAQDFQEFLTRPGKRVLEALGGSFRNAVKKDDPKKREIIFDNAMKKMAYLYTRGIDTSGWEMKGPA